jgi:hypothetical protein
MCGSFTVVLKGKDFKDEFNIKVSPDFAYESYNVAPSLPYHAANLKVNTPKNNDPGLIVLIGH